MKKFAWVKAIRFIFLSAIQVVIGYLNFIILPIVFRLRMNQNMVDGGDIHKLTVPLKI